MIVTTTATDLKTLLETRGVALGRTGEQEISIAGQSRQLGFYNMQLQNHGLGTIRIQNFDTNVTAGNLNYISIGAGERIHLSLRKLSECYLIADADTPVWVLYN